VHNHERMFTKMCFEHRDISAIYRLLFRHGGGVARVAPESTAAGHRDAVYMAHPIAQWQDAAEDE
jgi:hypothetical protein